MKKYNEIELNILKTKGKKALEEYRKSKRIPLGDLPNRVIESKKYRKKYKEDFEDEID